MKICSIINCSGKCHARGLCQMHYRRLMKHGSPNAILPPNGGRKTGTFLGESSTRWKGDNIGYKAMHYRILAVRGKASERVCEGLNCESRADQWAYDNSDTDEKTEVVQGGLRTYSLNVEHYVSLCVWCHNELDHPGSQNRRRPGVDSTAPVW